MENTPHDLTELRKVIKAHIIATEVKAITEQAVETMTCSPELIETLREKLFSLQNIFVPLKERMRFAEIKAGLDRSDWLKEVGQRDGNICRFCGCEVVKGNHRSPKGRRFVHLKIPAQSAEDIVISCRGCSERAENVEPGSMQLTPLKPSAQ